MPSIPRQAQTEDSKTFDPDKYFEAWVNGDFEPPYDNDFRKFIIRTFDLPRDDDYLYAASAEVSLLQAQTYIDFGAQGGLHAWYRDADNEPRPPPDAADIKAYTDIYRPTTNTAKALTALASNAKKDSLRMDIAKHLQSRYLPPSAESKLVVNKSKIHVNPYFDVWAWSNQNLHWGGPEENTVKIKISHAILPVFYHHFGCVCPSYEALSLIQLVSRGRRILDMGSGNGYWTYMLRRIEPAVKKDKKLEVIPIDNGISEWRTVWVGDTLETDGVRWLHDHDGGENAVLLLVYPTVGNSFTSKIINAYRGSTIIAASSQNANGFTAFAKETIADWMAQEMPVWERILQIPLPSFAGKDEALFIFEKKDQTVSV